MKLPRHTKQTHQWHNGAGLELTLYAQALRRAAKVLLAHPPAGSPPQLAWNAGPILHLYRQALEIELKNLVNEGRGYLKDPTNEITLYTTRSIRWLAQIVAQIIRRVHWQKSFVCAGIASLDDFKLLIDELDALEPIHCSVHTLHRTQEMIPPQIRDLNLTQFAARLEALLDLLAATTDSLVATVDLGDTPSDEELAYLSIGKPTIH